MSTRLTTLWPSLLVVAVVMCWCAFHMVGSWRHDPLRAYVLYGCSLLFLGSWAVALLVRWSRTPARETSSAGTRWNRACVAAFCLALAGSAAALPGLANFVAPDHPAFARCILLALACMAAAVLAAMVGLSHPRRRRGKSLGLAVFGIGAGLLLATILRVLT